MSVNQSLLLGLIALQNNFIDRNQLVSAFDRWNQQNNVSMAEILEQMKAISSEERALIEALAGRHLSRHEGDVARSLAALPLSSADQVIASLRPVANEDLQRSLSHLGDSGSRSRPDETLVPTVVPAKGNLQTRFRILRPHAHGGLGEVFVARDSELNRTVALKQIRGLHADDSESRARFVFEAEVTGALEHPGIVPVYGLGHYADGRPYYAMRFIRGDSLKEAIKVYHSARKEGLPGGSLMNLRGLIGRMVDVCEAIEYAHSRGVLHRDLKPGNIMLGRYGETLVVDWGLARTVDSPNTASPDESVVRPMSNTESAPTMMGSAVGTPHYMSPEQADGKLDLLGPRSDVYGLGATLYCVLTGESPVAGESVSDVLRNVKRGAVRPPRQVNTQVDKLLSAICLKALALDPNNRYQRAIDLACDLQQWMADEPVVAYSESLVAKTGRWLRRHRGIVQLIVVTTTIIIVGLCIGLGVVSRARQREAAAHERAQKSFHAARATVDRYFTQVSEETLLNQPGLQTLRLSLLLDALDYYQEFLQDHRGDTELQFDIGGAAFNAGRILEELGRIDESSSHYSEAMKVQRSILVQLPTQSSVVDALSDTLTAAGRLALKSNQYDQCSRYYSEALRLRQRNAGEDPNQLEYQRKLANGHMNLGYLAMDQGELTDAETAMQRAQDIREAGLENPDSGKLRRDYGKGLYGLGVLAARRNDLTTAREAFENASRQFENLVKENPLDLELKLLFATSCRLVGDAYARESERVKALVFYNQARDALKALSSRNPEVVEYKSQLAGILLNLADLQRHSQAVLAFESINDAVTIFSEVTESSSAPDQQLDLAVALRTRAELRPEQNHTEARKDLQQAESILKQISAGGTSNARVDAELEAILQQRSLLID